MVQTASFYSRFDLILHFHKLKNKGRMHQTRSSPPASQTNQGKKTNKRSEKRHQREEKKQQENKAALQWQLVRQKLHLSSISSSSDKIAVPLGFQNNVRKKMISSLLIRHSVHEQEEEIYRTQHLHFINLIRAWKIEGIDGLNTDHSRKAVHIGQQLVKIATKSRKRTSNKNEEFVTKILVRTTKRLAEAAAVEMDFTPLQIACIQGLPASIVAFLIDEELPPKLVQLQLQHGCSSAVNQRNDMGRIPLHSIVQCICDGGISYSEGAEIIDLLCAKDISTIHSSDIDMMSPTDLAYIALMTNEKRLRRGLTHNTTILMDPFTTKIQTINELLIDLRRISITSYRLYKLQCEEVHFETRVRLNKQHYESHEWCNCSLIGGGGSYIGISSPMSTSTATTLSESHSSLRFAEVSPIK